MPLKTILNRVFAKGMPDASDTANASSALDDPARRKRAISKVRTAAVLRGIIEEEEMAHPGQRKGTGPLQ